MRKTKKQQARITEDLYWILWAHFGSQKEFTTTEIESKTKASRPAFQRLIDLGILIRGKKGHFKFNGTPAENIKILGYLVPDTKTATDLFAGAPQGITIENAVAFLKGHGYKIHMPVTEFKEL